MTHPPGYSCFLGQKTGRKRSWPTEDWARLRARQIEREVDEGVDEAD